MKLTRILALILALVMLLSCFACSSGDEEEKEEENEKQEEAEGGEAPDLSGLVDAVTKGEKMTATVDISFAVEKDGEAEVFLEKEDVTVEDYEKNLTVLTAAKMLLEEYEVEYTLTDDKSNLAGVKGHEQYVHSTSDADGIVHKTSYFWDFKLNGSEPGVSSAKDERIYQGDVITFVFTSVSRTYYEPMDDYESEYAVPLMISKRDFEGEILSKITDESEKMRMSAFYTLYDASDITISLKARHEMMLLYPGCEELPVYVCEPAISSKELRTLDSIIKTYCPDYTIEDRDEDHKECGFVK